MKKTLRWLFFCLCLTTFLAFRMHAFLKKTPPVSYSIEKPKIPEPVTLNFEHPWLQRQPKIKGAAIEVVRDLEKIRLLSASSSAITEEALTQLMMEQLLLVQQDIPFIFPEELYNVLCITESKEETPATFLTFKRLYLGETELGMPFYLDVRVFDLHTCAMENVVDWHLKILNGSYEEIPTAFGQKAFVCKGKRTTTNQDASHGFAALQGDRGLFLEFYEKEKRLYVCYAEAPLTTFERYIPLFMNLVGKSAMPANPLHNIVAYSRIP